MSTNMLSWLAKVFAWVLLLHRFSVTASSPFHDAAAAKRDADKLVVQINTDGTYAIGVEDVTWLSSSPTFFRADGKLFIAGGNLKLVETTGSNGTDSFGQFHLITYKYQADKCEIMASIKTYQDLPLVLFAQGYINGANHTRAGNVNYVISGFPSFQVKDVTTSSGPLGYLAYGGMMSGDTDKSFGQFGEKTFKIQDGIAGGPIALFDGSGDAMVVSPASNFMAVSNWHIRSLFKSSSSLAYGIMGGVDTVPPDYTTQYIIYYSSSGVNKAFEGWGNFLRQMYNRNDVWVSNDFTIKYLGYWTDNGAYYYYHTEQNKTYQDTMLDIKTYVDQARIPYKYFQYDSWWYFKGVGDGVKTWESRPDIFPDGFNFVYNKTKLPASAHNRYWASDTTYAKQNGGKYNFIVEPEKAVPYDQTFWNDLFAAAKSWGLYTYEQDWLNKEFIGVQALLTDISLGSSWLNQMAKGAWTNGVTIQYCMSNSRHIMQALYNSVVTQARASDDYSPGSDQWKIGVSSIFVSAMGIAPYKDTFWTTTVQPGNPYGSTEPHNELQTAVSVFSTGPVGPSDMIGHTNISLLMRCCNADGLILKPSKPATAIDDQIYKTSLGSFPGPDGEVWSTFTNISSLFFGIIFAPEIHNSYDITPEKAGFGLIPPSKVFKAQNPNSLADFSSIAPLSLSGCNVSAVCIYYVTPVLRSNPNLVLLGELAKFVPMSPQRVTSIAIGNDVTVQVTGAVGERVVMWFMEDLSPIPVFCNLGASGTAIISFASRSCK